MSQDKITLKLSFEQIVRILTHLDAYDDEKDHTIHDEILKQIKGKVVE